MQKVKEYVYYFLLIPLVLSVSCGYTTKGFVYTERSIFIPPVENAISITHEERAYATYTSYPILVEKKLTNALIDKFNSEGNFAVSPIADDGLQLVCQIRNYRKEALRYTESDDIEEQRLYLDVHIILYNAQEEILQEKDIIGETTYFLSGSLSKSEVAAQQDLITDTVRRILEAVVEEW